MNKIVKSLFLLGILMIPGSCHAQSKRNTQKTTNLVKHTGYLKFTPVFKGVELSGEVIGSAWAVKSKKDNKIITAQHVVLAVSQFPGRLEVCSWKHNCINLVVTEGVGPVLGTGPHQDWIYWEVDTLPDGFQPSKTGSPKLGEPVCVVGAPLGRVNEITCGIVTNVLDPYMYVDARILPGNSGGPVFDNHGHVLGMVYAIDNPVDQGMTPVASSGICLIAERLGF